MHRTSLHAAYVMGKYCCTKTCVSGHVAGRHSQRGSRRLKINHPIRAKNLSIAPQALRVASKVPGTKSVRPTLERLYRNTCIGSRHFAVPDFTPQKRAEGDKALFPADGSYEVKGEWLLLLPLLQLLLLPSSLCRS